MNDEPRPTHSDGTRRASTPPEAAREFEQRNRLDVEISNLRMRNDWLREQLERPWQIENYREKCKTPPGTRRAVGASA